MPWYDVTIKMKGVEADSPEDLEDDLSDSLELMEDDEVKITLSEEQEIPDQENPENQENPEEVEPD
ncbi:hypothetical protein KKF61_07340 [Patescibacteria group bacterium]|nr:hypothetical protein [Patescibacteria group bacterium]